MHLCNHCLVGLGALLIAHAAPLAEATVSSGFTGVSINEYGVGNYCVADVYFTFDLQGATLLNVYNSQVALQGGLGQLTHDDLFGGSWDPSFANSGLDSFVTIGGTWGPGNTTAADPNWGFAGFNQPGIPGSAGWYNTFPPNGQGLAANVSLSDLSGQNTYNGLATLVMRLVIDQSLVPTGGLAFAFAGSLTFNEGLGTGAVQTDFDFTGNLWVPSPGALALLGISGLVGSRRRRR